ncbi:translation initiation factor IF-2 [Candidatus Methylomirabilis lanthanidiphila]|uniref:Translation initiation factor IF-2 n=1 Tax=Candidatus Methylomirabilis lanthanidiphila TaxID=2211376 RepID=A0A564ZGL2_9BACT|nr:translation initiation factor IF-2 [Candidatus Methylomirabilis lanthanidiphila]VUZ84434.1 translation initiation factor IF-2 [Candidatus Methylomirabilis lanthanidiphila]
MGMIRVYDLAKSLGISSKELLDRLEQLGLHFKSHSSNVDEDHVRSLLIAATSEKQSRPKPKLLETPPPVHATPAESRRPRTGKAEAPIMLPETSTRKPARSKPAETKEPSGAKPITEETSPAGKVSVVEHKGPQKPKAVSSLHPTQETAVLKRPSAVPLEPPQRPVAAATTVKAGPSSQPPIPPPPVTVPGPRATVAPPAQEPSVQVEETQRVLSVPSRPIIKIAETITVKELAENISMSPSEVIKQLIKMGIMTTINQPLDVEVVKRAADRLGFSVEVMPLEETTAGAEEIEDLSLLLPRSPVVTIMGHVDHGKTSLLDAIRQTNVIASEAGGITQHIGAYQVDLPGGKITFLDTPGHEAFTAMRARGAQATDIVVLVVAADDGVMPQTLEAVSHAKDAGVPILVAVNKIDKPGADSNRVMQQLAEQGLVPEDWGGQTIYAEVSAKKKIGIDHLLEMLLLLAEIQELKANPHKAAKGVIIEAELDRGRGPVATVLVQQGTLKVGDVIVAGLHSGRVRAMNNDKGKRVQAAGPATPVEVLGLSGVAMAGDTFVVVSDERKARQIALSRQQKHREETIVSKHRVTLEDLHRRIQEGEVKELRMIIKGDVQGSIGPFRESLGRIGTDAVRLKVIHASVGAINETDVMLASASNAVIVGFHVRPEPKAQKLAEQEGVEVRLYTVIYDAINEIRQAMEGLLEPTYIERSIGRVEVRQVFAVPKVGAVAGSMVVDGKVCRDSQVRLIRDSKVVHKGRVGSLRRFKEDVREVQNGFECGVGLVNYNDIKVGDVLEVFELESVAQKL